MPECPPRPAEEREHDRWEYVVGKALKDWVTHTMAQRKTTRAHAREIVLAEIRRRTEQDEA